MFTKSKIDEINIRFHINLGKFRHFIRFHLNFFIKGSEKKSSDKGSEKIWCKNRGGEQKLIS